MELGEYVRLLRSQRQWTQEELADAAGDPAEINRWLRRLFVRVSVVDRAVTAVVLA